MNVEYINYKDRNNLVDAINSLEAIYRKELMKERSLYHEDLYLMSAIYKSIKLIDSFLYALGSNNVTVLAILTRVQIDCALRTFGCAISNNSTEYAKKGLSGSLEPRKEFDKNKNKLTDKYLCQELEKIFDYPIYDLYQKTSSAIHLTSLSFQNIAKAENDLNISMFISRNNREEDIETFTRLSNELGSQFVFFGKVLIYYIFDSWIEQKNNENLD